MHIFKKEITLIAYLFLRLRPTKNVVRYMCKKFRSRLPFQKEHGKRVSTLLKSEWQHLHHIYWSTGRQLSCKRSVLVIWETLRLFLNTMTAVDKCSLPNRDNLMEPIHMWLDICVKSPTSDYPSKTDMVNVSQLCLNLSDSTCGIFIAQREGKLVPKSLF